MYDRSISDPVDNQIHVTPDHTIVFSEGNYLLANDDAAWTPLSVLWDDAWFIDVSEDVLKERLVNRHLENWTAAKEARFGPGRIGATAKVESSDLINARWVYRTSQQHACVRIRNERSS